MSAPDAVPPLFRALLLKVASRCNLDCDYCYWFRDPTVRTRPALLQPDAEAALLVRIEEHVRSGGIDEFRVILHGGEPLLFPKPRFRALLEGLRAVEHRTGCRIPVGLTTNAVLVDDEWAEILAQSRVAVTVSIDGPPGTHDAHRPDLRGRGSHARAVAGLATLTRHGLRPGVLAVCDPAADPDALLHHFVHELGLTRFDVLVPDATHEDTPRSIAPYYTRLFDTWLASYAPKGVRVRFLEEVLRGVLGGHPTIDSLGFGPIQLLVMLTDGALEPHDVLRIAGTDATNTTMNVRDHALQAVAGDHAWLTAWRASTDLPVACRGCEYAMACGGGYLPHRWSKARGFDNPSVYCDDYQRIFGHVWTEAASRIQVRTPTGSVSLAQAVAP